MSPTADARPRYRAEDLVAFATQLFTRLGLPEDRARDTAEILVESDLLGHTTHGLGMAPRYLSSLDEGGMTREGEPGIVADNGAAMTWDGRYLPGPWLIRRAIAAARERLRAHPAVTVVLRRSASHRLPAGVPQAGHRRWAGHPADLLRSRRGRRRRARRRGLRDHARIRSRRACPRRASRSCSTSACPPPRTRMTKRLFDEGGRLPGPWLVDTGGHADRRSRRPVRRAARRHPAPRRARSRPQGVRAGAAGGGAHLRPRRPRTRGQARRLGRVGLPAAHRSGSVRGPGGLPPPDVSGWPSACRASATAPGAPPVRLPGQAALSRRARQLADGVELYPTILDALAPWARRLEVALPPPI